MEPGAHNAVNLVEESATPGGYQLVNSQKTNKRADPEEMAKLAMAVQTADEFTRANAGNKLTVIAEQMKHLQEEARRTLEEAKRNAALHHAACNLVKKPGTMYYLYERSSGQNYLSILSPEEWGSSCPHEFLGAYRLEYDQSWTPKEEVDRQDEKNSFIQKVLQAQLALTSGAETADLLGKI